MKDYRYWLVSFLVIIGCVSYIFTDQMVPYGSIRSLSFRENDHHILHKNETWKKIDIFEDE